MNAVLLTNRQYSAETAGLQTITRFKAEQGKYYEIISPVSRDRIFFFCEKSGICYIKYMCRKIGGSPSDVFQLEGDAEIVLSDKFDEEVKKNVG